MSPNSFPFRTSQMDLFSGEAASSSTVYSGGMLVQSPGASPALRGRGLHYRPAAVQLGIRRRSNGLAGVYSAGHVFQSRPRSGLPRSGRKLAGVSATKVWLTQVRPFAVGSMLVAAFYTLAKMRKPLVDGIGKAFSDFRLSQSGDFKPNRLEQDLNFKWVSISVLAADYPYHRCSTGTFSGSLLSAVVAAIVMTIAGLPVQCGGRLSGGPDRRLEQPHLGPDALNPAGGRPADGLAGHHRE